jgi:phosphate acetyltransferase
VVLPEGTEERVLRAADVLLRRDVCDLTLLGTEETVRKRAAELGIQLAEAQIVDPETSPLRERFAESYAKVRAHKGVSYEEAYDVVRRRLVLRHDDGPGGPGRRHGLGGGAHHRRHDPARLRDHQDRAGRRVVSSVFFMCLADRVLVYGDCAVNPDPDAEQLADIAIRRRPRPPQFGIEPRVAMLSYSTGTSGPGADVDKVRKATDLVRERRPDLLVEGPIQYDAAVDAAVAATKLPDSEVAGKATVLRLPGPQHRQQHLQGRAAFGQRGRGRPGAAGPAQAGERPVPRRTVKDIVNTVAITAIQAQTPAALMTPVPPAAPAAPAPNVPIQKVQTA